MSRCWLPALTISVCAFPAVAASFDCTRAAGPVERAVCADAELSKLDDQLAAAYKSLLGQLSPNASLQVRQDQREWLRWLPQACPDHPEQPARELTVCLMNEYSARKANLENQPQRAGGMVFFPRVKVVALPNKSEPIPYVRHFEFWTGRFNWPQIDHPTVQQAAWNSAIRADIGGRQGVNQAEVTEDWKLKAANQQFISLQLVNSRYDYGAAHPNEEAFSFDWWLRLERPLKAQDVFHSKSGWEAALANACYEQLKSGDRAKDLYDDAAVRQATADAVKHNGNWSLDSRGLTVEFPEYSVAPRLAGFLSALIPWDRLRPWLAPGFDPATLPQPIERNSSPR